MNSRRQQPRRGARTKHAAPTNLSSSRPLSQDFDNLHFPNGHCWCINTNDVGVNVQVYTTSNKVMSIQDRLDKD